ncbi:DUF6145 family protein [Butyrivibrio sp. NC2002]|uniref:DUF6145 family protein n=1 Tax=Butyrivibrio sp. NC2002 TaxID=1410610 RepID=UPI000ACD17CF|nr:DUF6145 family protein [Butyrivibrio sp. NC2002]
MSSFDEKNENPEIEKRTENVYSEEGSVGEEEKIHSDTLNANKQGRRLIINKETGKITNAETGEEVSDIQVVTEDGSLGSISAGGRIILCGANAYEMKYYFNPLFKKIPESIQRELHIICVLFTQEAGGVFTIEFEDDGTITMETNSSDEDITYDEISAGLLIGEVRRQRQDLFEALQMYYRAMILHEDMSHILSEDDE